MKILRTARKPIVRKLKQDLDKTDINEVESDKLSKEMSTDYNNLPTEVLQVFPNARIYETNLTKKFKERKTWKSLDIQEIKSIIPGVVVSVNVVEGDYVTKGVQIMTFEAMKMHNIVLSPLDGTVKKIYVKEGQKVPKGDTMIFIKASEKFIETQMNLVEESNYVGDSEDKISDDDLGLIV